MGQIQEGLPLLFSEDPIWILRARLPRMETLDSLLVEVVDPVANRLCSAAELIGGLGRAFFTGREAHDLCAAKHKGPLGAKGFFESLLFLFGQGSNVDGIRHGINRISERTEPMFPFDLSQKDPLILH